MLLHKILAYLNSIFSDYWLLLTVISIGLFFVSFRLRKQIMSFLYNYRWQCLIFSIGIIFFGLIIINQSWVDIQLHCYILSDHLNEGTFPAYPLYYFLIYALSGFSSNSTLLIIASGTLLSAFFVFKYHSFQHYFKAEKENSFILFLLCFVGVIFYWADYQYIGKYSLTSWHNSTSIPLIPLSVFLLSYTISFLKEKEVNTSLIRKLILFSCISLLIKPSFMMVYLPVFYVFVLAYKSNYFIKSIMIFLPCILVLALEYLFIFSSGQTSEVMNQDQNSIALGWLNVWNYHSPSLTQKGVDLIMPIVFPILYLTTNPKAIKGIEIKFIGALFIFSIVLANVLYENGSRMNDGNFIWHVHIVNLLLFIYCTRDWLINKKSYSSSKNKIYMSIIVLHVCFGFLAMYNFINFGMNYNKWLDLHHLISYI